MILYDQDFNFIGMSAETLTFLGYEDIDEFSSMHHDFADLFVKKEGYIHKFENFSWIHYVLFSGAVNKKAFVQQKNGSEVPVDITIKEVFLNHTYDGLRKVYSVKLIHESFTNISKSEVHDHRSAKSTEFSLKQFNKDLDIPERAPAEAAPAPEAEPTPLDAPVPVTETAGETADFKLDIPDVSIFKEETPARPEAPSDFILHIPEETPAEAEAPAATETPNAEADDFILGSETESQQQEQKREINFDLFASQKEEEERSEDTTETISKNAAEPAKTQSDIFAFNLLKEEAPQREEVPAESTEAQTTQAETASGEAEPSPFSFDLFKKESPEKEGHEAHSERAEEPMQHAHSDAETRKRESLINQIKTDIEEIDAEVTIDPTEKEEASRALEALLHREQEQTGQKARSLETIEVPHAHAPQESEAELSAEATEAETAHAQPQAGQPEAQQENNPLFSFNPGSERADGEGREDSFEATLKDILSTAKSGEKEEQSEKKLNIFNDDDLMDRNQQSVTKEDIESPDQNPQSGDIELPKLGNLGLSKEEELDFIDEFLGDTAATVSLMREYLKIEDYNNIKYSLIKISSSAEILHFDQMLELARETASLCESGSADALAEKIDALDKITARYREHFSTITA